ncbi:FkbM family methyltransferase [Halogranum rubrum]|uniref:Methyltransferase FkbM domain-containing protein n=1 Tax=Halogranum salarium B-1 TaxID=1210908 RepID=J3JGV3_9EURY|nr:FkbM family methyltransferase [Halogranum salarium]EJN60454.1 hypothetical protein HSB1_10570 [Halogranum salarium B-1]
MSVSRRLHQLARLGFRTGRFLVFATYYSAIAVNHRHELYAPTKRVGDATFRSYELVNKHGRDVLLRQLLARCGPGDVVVDVGANTGVYSLAVAAAEPTARVVAFEANPAVCAQLRTNVRRNEFETRVDVRAVGLGDDTGTRRFYRSTYDELGSFAAANASAWEARIRDTVEVPIARLDDLVAAGDISPPNHLKVDVEGFGYEVLRGAEETLRRYRPVVYFEAHAVDDEERDTDAVAGFLHSLNYRIRTRDGRERAWVCEPESREPDGSTEPTRSNS